MQEPSIFTQIINGDIPSHKVYEDEKTLVILDIHPIQPGQVLVVPKEQVGFVWDMNSEDYLSLMATVHKVGQRLRAVFPEKKRVGVIVEGLDVTDHAHVKVFPFSDDKEFRNVPDPEGSVDHDALAVIAERLRF
jgi:histidine triad (HIT) family protein